MDAIHSSPGETIWSRLGVVARDIKLSHSVFALPFALLATFLAAGSASGSSGPGLPRLVILVLIVVCMVLARTVAMTVNRWADFRIDAANPRTAARAIPSGRLSSQFMLGAAVTCGIGFIVCTSGFWMLDNNPWPVVLSPLVLAYLAAYSFAKRFTWLCHIMLGGALALSPIATVIATEPAYLTHALTYLLALMVMCWVAGFDIIYALQDLAIDRAHGLHSIPARLGVKWALWISRGLHFCAAAALWSAWWLSPQLTRLFGVATIAIVALLVLQHALVWSPATATKPQRIQFAFLTMNGAISLLVGLAGITDVILNLP